MNQPTGPVGPDTNGDGTLMAVASHDTVKRKNFQEEPPIPQGHRAWQGSKEWLGSKIQSGPETCQRTHFTVEELSKVQGWREGINRYAQVVALQKAHIRSLNRVKMYRTQAESLLAFILETGGFAAKEAAKARLDKDKKDRKIVRAKELLAKLEAMPIGQKT